MGDRPEARLPVIFTLRNFVGRPFKALVDTEDKPGGLRLLTEITTYFLKLEALLCLPNVIKIRCPG
jgi:hypothetical protein